MVCRKSSGFSRGVSKYRGVARHHHNGRWEARIGRVFGNKYLYLGTYGKFPRYLYFSLGLLSFLPLFYIRLGLVSNLIYFELECYQFVRERCPVLTHLLIFKLNQHFTRLDSNLLCVNIPNIFGNSELQEYNSATTLAPSQCQYCSSVL